MSGSTSMACGMIFYNIGADPMRPLLQQARHSVFFTGEHTTVGEVKRLMAASAAIPGRLQDEEIPLFDPISNLEYYDEQVLLSGAEVYIGRAPLRLRMRARVDSVQGAAQQAAAAQDRFGWTQPDSLARARRAAQFDPLSAALGSLLASDPASREAAFTHYWALRTALEANTESRAQAATSHHDAAATAGDGGQASDGHAGGGAAGRPRPTYQCICCAGYAHWLSECPGNAAGSPISVRRDLASTTIGRVQDGGLALPRSSGAARARHSMRGGPVTLEALTMFRGDWAAALGILQQLHQEDALVAAAAHNAAAAVAGEGAAQATNSAGAGAGAAAAAAAVAGAAGGPDLGYESSNEYLRHLSPGLQHVINSASDILFDYSSADFASSSPGFDEDEDAPMGDASREVKEEQEKGKQEDLAHQAGGGAADATETVDAADLLAAMSLEQGAARSGVAVQEGAAAGGAGRMEEVEESKEGSAGG